MVGYIPKALNNEYIEYTVNEEVDFDTRGIILEADGA